MNTRDDIFALLDMLENTGHDISGGDAAIIAVDIIHEEFGYDHEVDVEEAVEIENYIIEWQEARR